VEEYKPLTWYRTDERGYSKSENSPGNVPGLTQVYIPRFVGKSQVFRARSKGEGMSRILCPSVDEIVSMSKFNNDEKNNEIGRASNWLMDVNVPEDWSSIESNSPRILEEPVHSERDYIKFKRLDEIFDFISGLKEQEKNLKEMVALEEDVAVKKALKAKLVDLNSAQLRMVKTGLIAKIKRGRSLNSLEKLMVSYHGMDDDEE